jgi:hypothetical protein
MRDLLLVILAFMVQPVRWLMPGDMAVPLAVWLVAFVIAMTTLIWLLRQVVRVIGRGR